MYTVMVTGGIGSGKSTLVELLCARGAVSIDLDEVNRSLIASNTALIDELAARFGSDIVGEDGGIVASKLAARAFENEQATKDLNAISFPYIEEAAIDYILDVECVPRSDAKVLVVEVPLLTEVPKFARLADEVIAVGASSDLRLSRAVKRGMDAMDAMRRMELQPTDEERAAIADSVCVNEGTREELATWVDEWWERHAKDFEG